MRVDIKVSKNIARIQFGELEEIVFEGDTEFETEIYDFALWAVMPLAMRLGSDIYFNYAVSKQTYESAMKVARVWANWVPEHFSFPKFHEIQTTDVTTSANKNLCFFSGGLDSTYSALRLKEENILSDSLTVHGMDYRYNDFEKFNALLKQTKNFRDQYFVNSYSVRTNIYGVYDSIGCNPFDGHITHIFALFASGSLFKSYNQYFIAADYRYDQQYDVHPYGSNSATNSLIHNAYGSLVTRDTDVGRGSKAKYLANSNIDLDSLSICVNYKFRPRNCGVCAKCMRTKVMFYASTGAIPKVFIDKEIQGDWFEKINVNNKIQRVFFRDILDTILKGHYSAELHYSAANNYWKTAASKARLGNSPRFKKRIKQALKATFTPLGCPLLLRWTKKIFG